MQVFQLLLGLAVLDSAVPHVHSDNQSMDDLTLLSRASFHDRHQQQYRHGGIHDALSLPWRLQALLSV